MKKRFLSIVLAVLMLVGIMPISVIAADAEAPAAQTGVSTKTSENTTGPKLEKSAQWVDEKAGIAKITIQVTGEQPTETTKKTDIVLVIDRSLSMTQNDREWLKNAKKAAKAFAKKVLTGDPNVRIAVVAYAAKTINDWDFSSKLATVEQHIDDINTNNVYYNGQWYANHKSPWSENWHGTNIQAGIHSARERLKKSDKDADKFMIVLADGAPNCRFGIYSASETWRLTSKQAADYHIKTDYREGGKQYFPNLYTANSTTFSYNNSDIMDEDSGYCYTATVSEAYAAKATDGITCYAIGYGIAPGSSLINALMYSISSTDAGFVNAGTDVNAITKVFSDIATDIQYKAHDVTLTDTMGAGFTYLANETYPSNPVVTPSADNKTVTWNVADELGDETKTLTFYVQYDKQNLTDAETLPTNTSASLSYKDNKGNAQTPITVDSPAIENLAKKVTYVDEDGNAYTDPAHQEKPHWYGDTVTLAPAPTKEGYTFNGWTTDDVTIGENDTFEMPKQNVTLKASWTKNTKTLTITKNWKGTTETPAVTFQLLQARKGENAAVYQTFKLDGVVDTGSEVVETAPWTATIEVPVKDTDGTEFKYSVKETKIGGTSTGAGAFNVTGTNPDNTPYIIGTWSVNSSGRPLEGTWTFTNKYTPKTPHTLTYQFVGENKPAVELPAAETLYENQQTDLAVVVAPDGWSFDGWYTDADCTEAAAAPYVMPNTDTTLYGKWTKEEQQPETTTITVKKEWRGLADGATKPEVEMTLWQSTDPDFKVLIENAGTLTLNGSTETTPWTGVFENVRLKNDEDEPLYYFVSETEIGGIDVPFTRTESVDVTRENEDGSITVIGTWHISREKNPATNTWTITNRYEDKTPAPVEKISITVEKRWDKNNSESVVKPNEISVQLTQNGVNYGEPVELSAANNWTYTFTELLETDDNGEAYNYSVKEPDLDARDGNGDVIGTWKPLIVQTDTTITITNTFVAKEPEPEPEDHEFTAHIVKRFENKSGKSPKATFTFVAALDDGTNVGRATISFSKGEVDAGDFERKDETMTVKLTDSQYEALEKDRIGRYLWIYEEDGEVDGVKYDTEPKKAYIYEKPVAWSLEFDEDGELVFSVPDENTLYCLVGDEMVEDFVFTNTYKKPGEKGETIKSGPQLNRDDHVAYIMGYPDGTVQPKGEITRAEACTIFFRLLTESSRDYYFSKTNDYTDVNAGDWFNNAISTLSNAGIVTGYNDGTFRPNQPITRGEMAKIIANFANLNKGTKSFTDLSGHWSKSYVELAAGNGWIAGYPDGSFRPDQKITRAETVTMINRVLERVPAKELRLLSRSIMLTFPDNNPGDWYYIAIQEASNSHEYQRSVYETTGDEMWTKLIDNVDWTKLEK